MKKKVLSKNYHNQISASYELGSKIERIESQQQGKFRAELHESPCEKEKNTLEFNTEAFSIEKIPQTVDFDSDSALLNSISAQYSQTNIKITSEEDPERNSLNKIVCEDRLDLQHLTSAPNYFFSLLSLDLASSSLSKRAIRVICSISGLKNLKSLNLSNNPIGNDEVKFMADTSNWNELEYLTLQKIQLSDQGATWLAMNESWKKLKELDLSENPLIGNLGALSLSLNRSWTHLKTLSLIGCSSDFQSNSSRRRNRKLQDLITKDNSLSERKQSQLNPQKPRSLESSAIKESSITQYNCQSPEKQWVSFPHTASESGFRCFVNHLRGGFPEGDGSDNLEPAYSGVLAKLQLYKEKILSDRRIERDLSLFIEVLASSDPTQHCNHKTRKKKEEKKKKDGDKGKKKGKKKATKEVNAVDDNEKVTEEDNGNCECKFEELSIDLRRNFFNSESSASSKLLLLTGDPGIGKSMVCKQLQREFLSAWREDQSPESDTDRENWFPIYIELSSLKNPKSKAISETLSKELSLTEKEISLLQTTAGQNNAQLPRLLFIFEGYSEIEGVQPHFDVFDGEQDNQANNFCVLNKIDGTTWKNAKFIITCREEALRRVQRRDLLFAPMNLDSGEISMIPGSFLQRKLQPFSDEQITCYLKKSSALTQVNCPSPSWSEVERFEDTIDEHGLREIARNPFMLRVLCDLLSDVTNDPSKTTDADSIIAKMPEPPTNRYLINCFVEKLLNSTFQRTIVSKEKEGKEESKSRKKGKNQKKESQTQECHSADNEKLQMHHLALRLSNYTAGTTAALSVAEDASILSKLEPLVEWDSKLSKAKFGCALFKDFFLAECIEAELVSIDPGPKKKNGKVPRELLLNQHLLTDQAIHFLQDSVKEERLKADQLVDIILLSSEKQDSLNAEEENHSNLNSPFTVAAVNAITILNSLIEFRAWGLSNICIPGANLSYGFFEGTEFTNANLKGVDFTGAWLKDVDLVQAQLENVDLGEFLNLKSTTVIYTFSYLQNGKYLALGTNSESVIFEKSWTQKPFFREIKRLPGYLPDWDNESISRGGKLVTYAKTRVGEYRQYLFSFSVWDIASGEPLEKFDVRMEGRQLVSYDIKKRQIIAVKQNDIEKYDFASNSWVKLGIELQENFTNCNLSSKCDLLLVGSSHNNTRLYSLNSETSILNQIQEIRYCKLSPDGKKIISQVYGGIIHVSDSVRGYIVKSLEAKEEHDISECSFTLDGKQILFKAYDRKLYLKDLTNSKRTSVEGDHFALDPDGKYVAGLTEAGHISFQKLPPLTKPLGMRGMNTEGLNLEGTNATGSFGLSDHNIMLLQQKGDYGGLDPDLLRKLFVSNSANSEDTREMVLPFKELSPKHGDFIGSTLHWIHLRVLDLSYNDIGEVAGQLIGSNQSWGNLEELVLVCTNIGRYSVKMIANNPSWKNLKRLELASNYLFHEGAAEIGKSKIWSELEILNLRQCYIGDKGAMAIGKNTHWKNLTKIDLSSNGISSKKGIDLLWGNTTWKNLKIFMLQANPIELQEKEVLKIIEDFPSKQIMELDLPGAKFDQKQLQCLKFGEPKDVIEISESGKGLTAMNAIIIGNNTSWKNLKKLDLSKNLIQDRGGEKIGSNASWFNLEEIDLSNTNLGVSSGIAIGENKTWQKLRVLNLSNNIGIKGGCRIGANKTWTNLQVLNLSGNKIEDEGARELAKNKTWTKLQALDLFANRIADEGVGQLSKNPAWINLQNLNLASNEISHKGIEELAQNVTWIALQILNLSENEISDSGAEGLSKNTTWTNLSSLNLEKNMIGAQGVRALIQNPTWTLLQTINFQKNNIGDLGVEDLSKNTTWIHLQTLHLGANKIGKSGATQLSKNTTWACLQSLDLQENNIGGEGAQELSKNTTWTELQTLNLYENKIGDKGVEALSKSTIWNKLQNLDLEKNEITSLGASELSKNTTWANLQTLDLGCNDIDSEGAAELSKNKTWKNLQTLNLIRNKIKDTGAVALSKNTTWSELRTLDLSSTGLTGEGVSGLCKNTTWKKLHTLSLIGSFIQMKAVKDLRQNPTWINLEKLNLGGTKLYYDGSDEVCKNTIWSNLQVLNLASCCGGCSEIGKNTTWINLQDLNLSGNAFNDYGAIRLGQNPTWANLRILDLSCCKIEDEGAEGLSKNTVWTLLQNLNLEGNKIRDRGAEELGNNAVWTNLQTLNLANNNIGDAGAGGLSKNTTWINLKTLNFRDNSNIGAEGARELGKNTTWIKLQTLELGSANLGDEGLKELSKNSSWINLETRNLSANRVSDEGAVAVSKNTTWTNLRTLDLENNRIGDQGAGEFSKNRTWINLRTLNLKLNRISEKAEEELRGNNHWTHLKTLDVSSNLRNGYVGMWKVVGT